MERYKSIFFESVHGDEAIDIIYKKLKNWNDPKKYDVNVAVSDHSKNTNNLLHYLIDCKIQINNNEIHLGGLDKYYIDHHKKYPQSGTDWLNSVKLDDHWNKGLFQKVIIKKEDIDPEYTFVFKPNSNYTIYTKTKMRYEFSRYQFDTNRKRGITKDIDYFTKYHL